VRQRLQASDFRLQEEGKRRSGTGCASARSETSRGLKGLIYGISGIHGTCLPAGRFIILLWHSSLAAQGRPVIASVAAAGL
jgi:hypothetical protein